MEENKEYQISLSQNDGILEIVVTGTVKGHKVSTFQKEIGSMRASISDKILVDIRSLAERDRDGFYHLRRPEKATGKTAVVDLPEHDHIKSLCEDVAQNTLMKVKWFSDIEAARNWLKSQ